MFTYEETKVSSKRRGWWYRLLIMKLKTKKKSNRRWMWVVCAKSTYCCYYYYHDIIDMINSNILVSGKIFYCCLLNIFHLYIKANKNGDEKNCFFPFHSTLFFFVPDPFIETFHVPRRKPAPYCREGEKSQQYIE